MNDESNISYFTESSYEEYEDMGVSDNSDGKAPTRKGDRVETTSHRKY